MVRSVEGAEDADEDLNQAIAMSLADDPSKPQERSQDEDAADTSKREASMGNASIAGAPGTAAEAKAPAGILGLDRKAMEQARLARLAARNGDAGASKSEHLPRPAGTSAVHGKSSSAGKRDRSISPPASKRIKTAHPAVSSGPRSSLSNRSLEGSNGTPLRYPRGTVKKTWSPYHEQDPGIKIEDIIDKANVKLAVVSTFMFDPSWIFSKFNVSSTKFYMILHASNPQQRDMLRTEFDQISQAKLCLPQLHGAYSCMHSKLMLLSYDSFLRIAIPTANAIHFDWGETGIMENSVFLIDLPRLPENTSRKVEELTIFGQSLLRFLDAQGVEQSVRDSLMTFDFSATVDMAFIFSSVKPYFDDEIQHNGIASLAAAVKQLELETQGLVSIDFAASSLGSLNDTTLNSLHAACRGADVASAPFVERFNKLDNEVRANTRIYFPTDSQVRESLGGAPNGGTICLQEAAYAKPEFPRAQLRNLQSTRSGMLSHNKVLLVRGRDGQGARKAWAYVGSANLSESAWGKVVRDRKTKQLKLGCNNWECGVLLPVREIDEDAFEKGDLQTLFRPVLDVPFECDGGDGKLDYGDETPWFFQKKG